MRARSVRQCPHPCTPAPTFARSTFHVHTFARLHIPVPSLLSTNGERINECGRARCASVPTLARLLPRLQVCTFARCRFARSTFHVARSHVCTFARCTFTRLHVCTFARSHVCTFHVSRSTFNDVPSIAFDRVLADVHQAAPDQNFAQGTEVAAEYCCADHAADRCAFTGTS